jgi:hypothetical protein
MSNACPDGVSRRRSRRSQRFRRRSVKPSARPLLTVIYAAPRQGFGPGRKCPERAALAMGNDHETSADGGSVWVSRPGSSG